MPFYDRWLDRTVARLGYTKAAAYTVAPVFTGEAPVGGEFGSSVYTDEQRERLAITSAWVYSDIRTIANEASAADVDIWQGQDEIEDHPIELLLERPNPHMSRSWMRQYTIQWLLLRGEAYWLKVFDRAGGIQELWPIPSSHIEPIPDAQKYIKSYKYSPANGQPPIYFDPAQIIFYRFPNPFDYHRGLSPLSAYRLALETDLAAASWNKQTFDDDVTLRTLISLPAEMSVPNFQRAKAEAITELVERQRRYMIVRAGDVSVNTLSISPKDLEYMAGRAFTRDEIDRVFGFPGGYWNRDATRANSDAAKAILIEQAVWPILILLAETLTLQLVQTDYAADLEMRFEDIRTEDRALLVQERAQYWQVKTVDEAREELGLDAFPDPEIGSNLVPLAIRGPAPEPGFSPLLVSGQEQTFDNEIFDDDNLPPEATADLKRWESIAKRRVRNGESAIYAFESAHIPAELKATIMAGLSTATTEQEVKAAFAADPFCGQDYP